MSVPAQKAQSPCVSPPWSKGSPAQSFCQHLGHCVCVRVRVCACVRAHGVRLVLVSVVEKQSIKERQGCGVRLGEKGLCAQVGAQAWAAGSESGRRAG